MKKIKIVFVCASLKVGGAEKSLVNILNLIDYNKYDVDLLLFQKCGEFLKQVPKEVKIKSPKKNMKALYDKVPISINNLFFKFVKYTSTIYEKLRWKEYDALRAHRWKDVYNYFCEPLKESYDVAVAFQSGEPTYFTIDKITAKRKVVFFHTDISNIVLDEKIENEYLEKADLIATISNKCVESIKEKFPKFSNKTICLENPTSSKLIWNLAGDIMPDEYNKKHNIIRIVSVGRLVNIKGYDMAIDAAKILRNSGLDIQWYIVGEGNERPKLENQIQKNKLENDFHLIGLRSNPYPYMKFADILVQSSRYEGKSVVLDEAKILGIPIVVTDYNSVRDQISDGKDGYIAKMSAEGIANCIKCIIDGKKLKYDKIESNDEEVIEKYMNALIGKKM